MSEVDSNSRDSDTKANYYNPDHSDPPYTPNSDTSTETDNSDSSKQSESSVNSLSEDNQASLDKTIDESLDQTNLNKSRELKSILALSKEANLKTNISHKRKKDVKLVPKGNYTDLDSKKSSRMAENRSSMRFPVTAESELEELQESDVKSENDSIRVIKKKREEIQESDNDSPRAVKRRYEASNESKREHESKERALSEESDRKSKKGICGDVKVFKPNKDSFCWRCHREGVNIGCETCPRAYHQKCLKQNITDLEHWPCPECVATLRAESSQTRIKSMKGMSIVHLSSLLEFALKRMIQCQGSEPFLHPVSENEFPEYKKYITQPMDLSMLKKNIGDNVYGSVQAFEADAKWLLHNSIIFNSYQSKLTTAAKNMIKICKQEMMEIENCPSCYLKANVNQDTWFVEVCPIPHIPVWAKLKGFPYWPAKAMCVNTAGLIDVRFFGAHDRAWVHWKDCFLYSDKDPNTFKQKRYDIEKCVEELAVYIENLKKIYGEFRYAPFRTPVEPTNLTKQLQVFLPKYKSITARRKSLKESNDVKTTTEIESENPAKEETAAEQEKSEAPKSNSGISSPTPDHDSTMEGYGTDSDMPCEINLKSRETFANKKNTHSETTEDEEDLDDTQVPSNVSVENSSPQGHIRTRRNSTSYISKPKGNSCRSCDSHTPSEEVSTPKKPSRRNSDQSVKSDSSRLSNVSDKISRVVISEDMEMIVSKEIKNLVTVSDNINVSNGENVEIKKKPVQVDINNIELSISPNKLKSSSVHNIDEKNQDVSNSIEEKNYISSSSTPVKQIFKEKEDHVEESQFKNEEESKAKVIQPSITEFFMSKSKNVDFSIEKISNNTSDTNKCSSPVNINIVHNGLDKTEKHSLKTAQETAARIDTNIKESIPTATEIHDEDVEMIETSVPNQSEKENSIAGIVENDTNKRIVEVHNANKETHKLRDILLANNSSIGCTTENRTIGTEEEIPPTVTVKHVSEKTTDASDKATKTLEENSSSGNEVMEEDNDEDMFDPKKIRDVIHSSLNSVKNVKVNIDKRKNGSEQNESSEELTKVNEVSKKRKLPSEDETSFNPAKLIKLVPIESIINKKKGAGEKETQEKDTTENRPSEDMDTNSNCVMIDDIKSEPESDEEFVEEVQNLEEKRKYLSALNIHEKTIEREKKEKNEIRTRSKAEEKRERFKVVDNLTRIIDDVALNYSAKHEVEKSAVKKPERRKSGSNQPTEGGEIYVKSFARLTGTSPSSKQRARKTFPMPLYFSTSGSNPIIKKDVTLLRREPHPQRQITVSPEKNAAPTLVSDHSKSSTHNSTSTLSTAASTSFTSMTTPTISLISQTSVGPRTSPSMNMYTPTSLSVITSPAVGLIQSQNVAETTTTISPQTLAMGHVILMPSTGMNYCAPIISTMAQPNPSLAPCPTPIQTTKKLITPNLKTSQNYIPSDADENVNSGSTVCVTAPSETTTTTSEPSTSSSSTEVVSTESSATSAVPSTSTVTPAVSVQEEEFSILQEILPETVSRTINEFLLRPPPRLKPRPPGMVGRIYDEGIPSSAGDVTARINSIAHRMTDYFRGMLIETLEELGKASHPEAKITSLQLELEAVKHRHEIETAEMRKTMTGILQNIQKRVVEERTIIVDKTRAACEAETVRRVESAKSKQWCANCPREAQFYCCWNTSYCDYPCQQKHWPQHAAKCTQDVEKSTGITPGPPNRPTAPLILRPAIAPKPPGLGRMQLNKPPPKVYVNRTNAPQKGLKNLSGLTFVETTPGNYELIGNNSISLASGKLLPTSTSIGNSKFKGIPSLATSFTTVSTVTADSNKQTASSSNKP